MEISEFKNRIKEPISFADQDLDIWTEAKKPIRKAYVKFNENDDKEGYFWGDIIKCKICGRNYTRSNISNHRKSQFHKAHQNINNKIQKLILGD